MSDSTAVLLINLGTPSEPTESAVRTYLTEFLLDRHVVDLPALFWKPLLKYCILPKRLPTTTGNYRKIWTEHGSPLAWHSQQLVDSLAKHLPSDWYCALAMTYGAPALADVLNQLKDYQKIKVIPLFPHYSTTTTQAVIDKIIQLVSSWSHRPNIECIQDYAEHPDYITALYRCIKVSFARHGIPDRLILSYHGIPMRYVTQRQDGYLQRCEATTRHLTDRLQHAGIAVAVSHVYQSRFGKGKWSEPNISSVLDTLAREKCHDIHVMCPGFAVDCIETLEEIAEENKHRFLSQGGQQFHYIPALNNSTDHCQLMLSLLQQACAPLPA